MGKLKYLLLDFDGVVNLEEERPSSYISRTYGIDYDQMLEFFNGEFQLCILGEGDMKKVLAKYLRKWNTELTVEEFVKIWFDFHDTIDLEFIAYLKELKKSGLRCFILTKQEQYRTEWMRKTLEEYSLFEEVYSTCEIGIDKSDPGFFEAFLDSHADVTIQNSIFWDDSEKNVVAAREAGLKAEMYKNFAEFKMQIKL